PRAGRSDAAGIRHQLESRCGGDAYEDEHDHIRQVDADVSWSGISESGRADRIARRRWIFFHELGHGDGGAPAGRRASDASIDAQLRAAYGAKARLSGRSEEHTSELQSRVDLVCRLLLEKKKKKK